MRTIALITLLTLALTPVVFAGEKEEMAVFHDKGYLVAQSEDGKTKYWIDGRIMLDYGEISSDNNLPSGWETRRARLGVKTIFDGKWAGEFDMDIADNEVEIKDFWMAYIGAENTIVKVGNHKPPGSMEEVTTSRWLTFMERSLANGFASGRRIGVSYNKWGEKYFFMGGYYGQEPGTGEEEGEDEATGIAARVAFAPILSGDKVLHLGASYGSYEPEAGEDDRVRFRGRELHLMDRMLNTGKVRFVDDYELMGIELAGQNGPWSFQSEYLTADLNRFAGEQRRVVRRLLRLRELVPVRRPAHLLDELGGVRRDPSRGRQRALWSSRSASATWTSTTSQPASKAARRTTSRSA